LRQRLKTALATLFIEPASINVSLDGVDPVHDAVARNLIGIDAKTSQCLNTRNAGRKRLHRHVMREIMRAVDISLVPQNLRVVIKADAIGLVIVDYALFLTGSLPEPDCR